MDLMSSAQLLSNVGEFVGAVAVVLTLVYLAIQVRHSKIALEANTRSLDENQRLAVARTYQSRTDSLNDLWSDIALSDSLSQIIARAQGDGLAALTEEELFRLKLFQTTVVAKFDNVHYQYQQGFLDEEYFQTSFRSSVRTLVPTLRALNLMPDRPSFRAYVEEVFAEGR
jgi:hypothetical protein